MLARIPDLLRGLAIFAAYLLGGWISIRIREVSGTAPLVWMPTGVGLAAIMIGGLRFWPWVLAGALATNFARGHSIPAVTLIALLSTAGSVLAALFLKRYIGPRPTFAKIQEIMLFILLVMGVSEAAVAGLKILGLVGLGVIPADRAFLAWRSWWLGGAMGQLIVAGSTLIFWNDLRYRLGRLKRQAVEATLLTLAIGVTAVFNFTEYAHSNHSVVVRPYFLFSLMIWAAVRFDLWGAVMTILIASGSLLWGSLQGFVLPGSLFSVDDRVIMQQLVISALGMTGLVIAAAIREKDEAVEARNVFLSVASHELKTPITSLKLQLQVSQKKLKEKAEKTPHEIEQLVFVGKFAAQVNRLVRIVEQLLDVSRVDRDDILLSLEEIDLAVLIHNVVQRSAVDLSRARCALEFKLEPGIVGRWDTFRLEQMLDNLLSNAMKYAPGKPIQIETFKKGDFVEIVIRDQGPGMDESVQTEIFNRFVRAHGPRVSGLGLGLFITRQLVEAHDGAIWVRSAPGAGASFHLRLPLSPSRGESAVQPVVSV